MSAVMGSVCRAPLAVVVVMVAVVAVGAVARQQQGPLTCWSCLAHTQGPDCYDLDDENMTLTKMCNPEEVFCTVSEREREREMLDIPHIFLSYCV